MGMGRVIVFTPRTGGASGFLLMARERCGMQRGEFARALGHAVDRPLSAGAVEIWERGDIEPPVEIVAAARELATGIGLATTHPAATPSPSDGAGEESRARAPEVTEAVAGNKRIDPTVVEVLREHTGSFRQIDRRLGAGVIFDQLTRHIVHLESLLKHPRAPRTGELLATALAEACTLAGWQALDLGKLATAWSCYETAKVAASEAGDRSALAHATAEQAYVLIDAGRCEAAIGLVAAAQHQIRRLPPRLAAWLHSAAAEALAAGGYATLAQRSLDVAAARCPASPSEPELPYLALDGVHLERWRGSTLAHLGHPEAVRHLSDVLTRMDRTFTRAAAGLHADLALALARAGEQDEARHHMHRAQKLADTVGSVRQRRRAQEWAASLFDPTVPTR
jgi:hypothetical protein